MLSMSDGFERDGEDSSAEPGTAGAFATQMNSSTGGGTVIAAQNGDVTVNCFTDDSASPLATLDELHRHAVSLSRGLRYRSALEGTRVPVLRTDLAVTLEELDDPAPVGRRLRRAAAALRPWVAWVPDSEGLFLTDAAAVELWCRGSGLRDACAKELEAVPDMLSHFAGENGPTERQVLSDTLERTAAVVDSMSSLIVSLTAVQQARLPDVPEMTYEQKRAAGHLVAILKDLRSCSLLLADVCTDAALGALVTGGVLIAGGWGTGKSYGAGGWVESRVAVGAPTALVCGYQFDGRHGFEEQLAELCGARRRSSARELLGTLQAHARTTGRRAVLVIDALNEVDAIRGDPHVAFAALVQLARGFPDVMMVATVRMDQAPNPEEGLVDLVRERPFAFRWNSGVTDPMAAWRMYQDMYGLPTLILPPDTRDLRRPFLLSILAWSLHHSPGPSDRPVRVPTVGGLFKKWLRALDEDWARHRGHSMSQGAPSLVTLACELISEAIGVHESIEYGVALGVFGRERGFPDADQLVGWLHGVGVIAVDPVHGHVRFAVQRFAEHVRARNLLHQARPRSAVARLVSDLDGEKQESVEARRMLAALAVAAPYARTPRELSCLLPRRRPLGADIAVLESLEGREHQLVGQRAFAFVRKKLRQPDAAPWAWYSLLVNATEPGHPLGTGLLDRTLSKIARTGRFHRCFVLPVLELIDHEEGLHLLRRLLLWAGTQHEAADAARDATTVLMWLSAVPYEGLRDVCIRIASDLWMSHPAVAEAQVARFGRQEDALVAEAAWLAGYGALARRPDRPTSSGWLRLAARDEARPHLRIQDSVAGVRGLYEPCEQDEAPPVPATLPPSTVLIPDKRLRADRIESLVGHWTPFPEASPLPRLHWLSRRTQYLQPQRPIELFRTFRTRNSPPTWSETIARRKPLTIALQEWYAVQASHLAEALPAAAPSEGVAARWKQRTTDPTLPVSWPTGVNTTLRASTWWGVSPDLDGLMEPNRALAVPLSEAVIVHASDGSAWLLLHGQFHCRPQAGLDHLSGLHGAEEDDEALPPVREPPAILTTGDLWSVASPARRPAERGPFVEINAVLVRTGAERLVVRQLRSNRFDPVLHESWPGQTYLAEYYRRPEFAVEDKPPLSYRPTTVTYPARPHPPHLQRGSSLPYSLEVPARSFIEQLGAKWTGHQLNFDRPGNEGLVLTDPSLTHGGPNALLLTPAAAERLAADGWTLLWHVAHTDRSWCERHRYALLKHGEIVDLELPPRPR
ncbi:hypothetical protein ACIF6I_00620 [Streptomyces microflavus]|uniref:hypothetical protein n=1 Tax=Streptomyces microflavus TaxID=1919 RepID=UPI0037CD031E